MFAPAKTLSAVAALAMIATAGVAWADTKVRSVEVRYSDLNLAKKADQSRLKNRISRAAINVCTDPNDRRVDAECRWKSVQNAKAPIAAAIAKAESGERYADAGNMTVGAGN